jgi:hypothetical protein
VSNVFDAKCIGLNIGYYWCPSRWCLFYSVHTHENKIPLKKLIKFPFSFFRVWRTNCRQARPHDRGLVWPFNIRRYNRLVPNCFTASRTIKFDAESQMIHQMAGLLCLYKFGEQPNCNNVKTQTTVIPGAAFWSWTSQSVVYSYLSIVLMTFCEVIPILFLVLTGSTPPNPQI